MIDPLDPRVAVAGAAAPYPAEPPFAPPERYPEFPWPEDEPWDAGNRVYPAVRRLLAALGLDRAAFGTPAWNPLGELIRPGDRVVLKPNYILHRHLSGKDPFSVVTHPAVVRAVLDYVVIALAGRGRVVVADAPQANTDWEALVALNRIGDTLAELKRRHRVEVELRDLRALRVIQRHGITTGRLKTGAEAVLVDLGPQSSMAPLGATLENLCGSDYDRHRTVVNHRQGHRYAPSRTILEADVLISLPKLKVHKKTGVSLNLKNMVGINADKNFIPHYRVGDAASGGDEFPPEPSRLGRLRDRVARAAIDLLLGRLDRLTAPALATAVGAFHEVSTGRPATDPGDAGYNQAVIRHVYRRLLGKPVRAGNWSGNDTLWRAVLDLNRIALYGRPDGTLRPGERRRFFCLIDGVVGGEGEGPMDPDPVPAGLLVAGFNPLLTDRVATEWMGLDWRRIPLLGDDRAGGAYPLAPPGGPDLRVEPGLVRGRPFAPPSGWPSIAATRADGGAPA